MDGGEQQPGSSERYSPVSELHLGERIRAGEVMLADWQFPHPLTGQNIQRTTYAGSSLRGIEGAFYYARFRVDF